MRGLIIDDVRRRRSQKRGGLVEITSLRTDHAESIADAQELALISDALEELGKVDADLAQIVDLKFFCGFSFAEIAAMRGVSERISVRSIVGRFLEHSRVYYFENAGERDVYCGSADWMDRNLFRRIEVAFPVTSPDLQARVTGDLHLYLADDCQAWDLKADGR
jgi:hypothetical protein